MNSIVESAGIKDSQEPNVLYFTEEILGFEEDRNFILSNVNETPFCMLQSLKTPELEFILVSPWCFKPEYSFDLPNYAVEKLKVKDPEEVAVYSIVASKEDGLTINLLAPVVINVRTGVAMQVVLHATNYEVAYRIEMR